MVMILLILIFIRPFISSLAFPLLNLIHSFLLLGFLLIWIMRNGIPFDKIKPVSYPLALFIMALLASFIFSQDKINSFKELYVYTTALLLFSVCAGLSAENKSRLISWILSAGFLVSLLAIYQYLFGFQNLSSYAAKHEISDPLVLDYISCRRVFSPFVTPNTLGGYLIMVLPLAFIKKKTIWLALPMSCALLLTQSLGSLLSILIVLALIFCLVGKSKRRILYLAGLAAVIVIIFFLRARMQKAQFQPAFSALMRLNYWQETLQSIKNHPFFGVGPGNFNLLSSRYAHNSYLQIWADTGILGIAAFLWFIIAAFKSGLKNLETTLHKNQVTGLICASLVFLIHNFVDFSFFLPEVSLIWWAILGCLFSALSLAPQNNRFSLKTHLG